ncbi:MAG: carbon-nitrogen hydrolase family protein, partial [Candidatus Marinimicrobia bacterium]|nr:carbon-nitrogen hydrolase family protein [Candidatus Neomarinimicrobiota bacterium]
MMPRPLQVALVQASPVHVNLEATLDKVDTLTREAAALGAKLVVFGETFITGYPAWIDSSPGAALWD